MWRQMKTAVPALYAAFFCGLLALAGCATNPRDDGPKVAGDTQPDGIQLCCANAERLPHWLVDLAEPLAPGIGTAIGHVHWRKGYMLAREEAHQAIRRELKPLDILLVSSKNRLSGHNDTWRVRTCSDLHRQPNPSCRQQVFGTTRS